MKMYQVSDDCTGYAEVESINKDGDNNKTQS